MATYNKFECFVGDLGTEVHQLHTDVLKVYLTNNAPSASADSKKGDLVGATEENGYTAADVTNTYTETSGTGTLAATDVTITAAGGTVGPFRYVVLYNDTATDDPLIGWWDYASSITMNAGESFKVDFGANILTLA